MKEIVDAINDFLGISNMQTASNLYTIALTFYLALYMVLWFFRRGERYKMLPDEIYWISFVTLLFGSYIFGLGQILDPQMEYYPFAFWSNLTILLTVIGVWLMVMFFNLMCRLREHLPKQD